MIAAAIAWLGSKGVSLLLGYAFGFLLDLFKTWQAAEAQREAGRKEVEAAQAQQGAVVNAELAKEAAKRITEDDAISALDAGRA